ncbi:DUF1104 domain-containing protein [Helicobacter suis]|uniref:DUF1104 domain-containing protein n=1 Tax=Helicobacter suis TaxID=104628 RepID=UPI0013D5F60D|nr:DUF1104 domain-containing protein [Helicobacter suis]
MRQFLKIFIMGMLALGVAHAEEVDFSKLSNKDLVKMAGKVDASQELEYHMEVHKRLKKLKGVKAKEFHRQVERATVLHLSKMSKKKFMALREEVAGKLEEMKKEHSPEELKSMGLDVEICKGEQRKILCHVRHARKGHKGGAHHGQAHNAHHEDKAAPTEHHEEHKAPEENKAPEEHEAPAKTPAKAPTKQSTAPAKTPAEPKPAE